MHKKPTEVARDLAGHIDRYVAENGLPPLIPAGLGRFRFNVTAVHEEGTTFHYDAAYAIRWRQWLMIFPEHHQLAVLHVEELHSWKMSERVKTPLVEVPGVSLGMGENLSLVVLNDR